MRFARRTSFCTSGLRPTETFPVRPGAHSRSSHGTHAMAAVLCALVVSWGVRPLVAQQPVAPASRVPSAAEEAAERLGEALRQRFVQDSIPGLAAAIVSDTGTVWTASFGVVDGPGSRAVDSRTIFSIQSLSKSFTALAVFMAVQEGLVALDTPIVRYLPDFRVSSGFEEHPERRITLRHLLNHRAGLVHEAPFGSNSDTGYDFPRHIASISETSLRSPVGSSYSYSNLGIDLAGYIVQVRSRMPFADYVRTRVLEPLGMRASSFDMEVVRRISNRAVGHRPAGQPVVLEIPMIPAGGLYASVEDVARFLRFHLGNGSLDGRRLLREDLFHDLHAIQFTSDSTAFYANGLIRRPLGSTYLLAHNGEGFGFQSTMAMFPDVSLGIVVLTNASGYGLNESWTAPVLVEIVARRAAR